MMEVQSIAVIHYYRYTYIEIPRLHLC
jgi:hypothetical protein